MLSVLHLMEGPKQSPPPGGGGVTKQWPFGERRNDPQSGVQTHAENALQDSLAGTKRMMQQKADLEAAQARYDGDARNKMHDVQTDDIRKDGGKQNVQKRSQ